MAPQPPQTVLPVGMSVQIPLWQSTSDSHPVTQLEKAKPETKIRSARHQHPCCHLLTLFDAPTRHISNEEVNTESSCGRGEPHPSWDIWQQCLRCCLGFWGLLGPLCYQQGQARASHLWISGGKAVALGELEWFKHVGGLGKFWNVLLT